MNAFQSLLLVTILTWIALAATVIAYFKKIKAQASLEKKVSLFNEKEKLIQNEFQALMDLIDQKTRELEEQRNLTFHASKMSALGEMAGGIAHEINNPLTIIMATIRKIKLLMNKGQLEKDVLLKICDNVEMKAGRISRIIEGLRIISREASQEEFKQAKILDLLDDVLALCEEKIKTQSIELHIDYDNPVFQTYISCQRSQLSQVFWNLLENAFDAILNLPEKWIKIEVQRTDGFIEIRFVDSGKGLSEELREKVFQPFYTTKEVGKGTGLGLSLSLAILKNHHGDLFIDSNSANTCFVVRLPVKSH